MTFKVIQGHWKRCNGKPARVNTHLYCFIDRDLNYVTNFRLD